MSARLDQRGKAQQQQQQQPQNHQVNGNVRVEEYDYTHATQMHPQPHPQQAQYNASLQMPSPTAADSYSMNTYHYPSMSYPAGFFDSNAWSTSTSNDPLSYLGGYGQQMGAEYMQFPGYDYTPGFWQYHTPSDYTAWAAAPAAPQQDAMKMMDGQAYMTSMDQAYSETYHSPNSSGAQKPAVPNGQETAAPETEEAGELAQAIEKVSLNGHSEESPDSPSETSLHEASLGNVNNSSAVATSTNSSAQAKSMSWANIAKKPAKPTPPTTQPAKILTRPQQPKPAQESGWTAPRTANSAPRNSTWTAPRSNRNGNASNSDKPPRQDGLEEGDVDPTISKLKQSNACNPKSFDLTPKHARFFVIKSYSEDDIHRAIKYRVWCSTEHGNKRLDDAFKDMEGKGPIYLFYSVNGSGHFCGMAQMLSGVDYQTHAGVWTQDKWKGSMEIKWIYVKDVPNGQLRHIRLENNENKPVTNSRDTQEVPYEKGKQVLKIIHTYRHSTSIFDDFSHYEKKEVEEGGDATDKKKTSPKITNGNRN